MSRSESEITAAVRDAYAGSDYQPDPARRGPVPLYDFFEDRDHIKLFNIPGLNTVKIVEALRASLIKLPDELTHDLTENLLPLEGLIIVSHSAYVFVNNTAVHGRQRFTAAHELGHYLLHKDEMQNRIHTDATMEEFKKKEDTREAEANRFAAELLMPEVIIRARLTELERLAGCRPRAVLIQQLASELLVSREALTYRFDKLGITDE